MWTVGATSPQVDRGHDVVGDVCAGAGLRAARRAAPPGEQGPWRFRSEGREQHIGMRTICPLLLEAISFALASSSRTASVDALQPPWPAGKVSADSFEPRVWRELHTCMTC